MNGPKQDAAMQSGSGNPGEREQDRAAPSQASTAAAKSAAAPPATASSTTDPSANGPGLRGSEPLLEVRDLWITFDTPFGPRTVVDGVSFDLGHGETLGLVGESGCGKSVTSLALMGLLGASARVQGSIRLRGEEIARLDEAGWRRVRGRRIAMVFQDPMTSLNPLIPIGRQLTEVLSLHKRLVGKAAEDEAAHWLDRVGIPDARQRLRAYPHELSGGMRQRALIAVALCGGPELLLADEPTTALDVTIQAQILDLLAGLGRDLGMSMLFITHDLGVVERVADRIAVMYAGRIVELGGSEQILSQPRHPYARGLLQSVPGFRPRRGRLRAIPGTVPAPGAWPEGCRFHPRCPFAAAGCLPAQPALEPHEGRLVACVRQPAIPPFSEDAP